MLNYMFWKWIISETEIFSLETFCCEDLYAKSLKRVFLHVVQV